LASRRSTKRNGSGARRAGRTIAHGWDPVVRRAAAPGFPASREITGEGSRFRTIWLAVKINVFKRFRKNHDAPREQNNRKNNRPVTGG
jgi:hypothetical protein